MQEDFTAPFRHWHVTATMDLVLETELHPAVAFLDYTIVAGALAGVVINIGAFAVISGKQKRLRNQVASATMFHDLLKILMVYDVFVVICCPLQFALPHLSTQYKLVWWPKILPWLIPIMHIAVMSSVYCTILISFERYIRICYYCQLRSTNLLTEENIKFYKICLVLFPLVFYLPKWFEIRSRSTDIEAKVHSCHTYIYLAQLFQDPNTRAMYEKQNGIDPEKMKNIMKIGEECLELNFGNGTAAEPLAKEKETKKELEEEKRGGGGFDLRNKILKLYEKGEDNATLATPADTRRRELLKYILERRRRRLGGRRFGSSGFEMGRRRKRRRKKRQADEAANGTEEAFVYRDIHVPEHTVVSIETLPLRENKWYYRIYYVGLNTFFAAVLPLLLLLFLNMRTAAELFKMGRTLDRSPINVGKRKIVVRSSFRGSTGRSGDKHSPSPCPTLVLNPQDEETANSGGGKGDASDGDNVAIVVDALSQAEEKKPSGPAHMDMTKRKREIFALSGASKSLNIPSKTAEEEEDLNEMKLLNGGDEDGTKGPAAVYGTIEERDEETTRFLSPKSEDGPGISSSSPRSASTSAGPASRGRKKLSGLVRGFTVDVPDAAANLRDQIASTLRLEAEGGNPFSLSRRSRGSSSLNEPQINKRNERKLAYVSLYIVWLFIFCHAWKLVPTIYEVATARDDVGMAVGGGWPAWVEVVERISHTLITLNSSLNFLIYVVL